MKQTLRDPLLSNYISSWEQRANHHHKGKAPPSHLEALGGPPVLLKLHRISASPTVASLSLQPVPDLKSLAHPGIPKPKICLSWVFLFQPTQ